MKLNDKQKEEVSLIMKQVPYCTMILDQYCNKCNTDEKEQRECIKTMHEIDGWW